VAVQRSKGAGEKRKTIWEKGNRFFQKSKKKIMPRLIKRDVVFVGRIPARCERRREEGKVFREKPRAPGRMKYRGDLGGSKVKRRKPTWENEGARPSTTKKEGKRKQGG